MVPVNVRCPGEALGNRISFVFVELPCDEPYPLKRLHSVHASMRQRKRQGEPEGADLALKAAEHTPPVVQHAISRLVASPRTFNLTVSNIPGPVQPLYMLGCPLHSTYPIVPLSEKHGVSVGMTTVHERACFGVYADPEVLPDADALAHEIEREIDELLAGTASRAEHSTPRAAA
jgi:diacylglycerol O-acyltransferase